MRIAVIGSGVSGLVAAWLLQKEHEVVIFEAENCPGGHARTLDVQDGEDSVAVDTGFIVFNYETYPVLTRLFDLLKVPVKKSSMSFGVSLNNGRDEYGTVPTWRVFSSPRNLVSRRHWRTLKDIQRFARNAPALLESGQDISLGEYLRQEGYSEAFRDRFLIPMAASIWSTAASRVLEFPARSLVSFLQNHGLLEASDRKQWYTVDGGSREYVNRLLASFGGELRLGCPVTEVSALAFGENGRLRVKFGGQNSGSESFDQVIFACHTDQALSILQGDSRTERQELLQAIPYQNNRVLLHSDSRLMPRNRKCWQSWVYRRENSQGGESLTSMSYWMNNLQSLVTRKPLLVTLNPEVEPQREALHDEWHTGHPQYRDGAMDAQSRLDSIQGQDGFWFCGAWTGYGFHEDGARSGLKVANALGVLAPWQQDAEVA